MMFFPYPAVIFLNSSNDTVFPPSGNKWLHRPFLMPMQATFIRWLGRPDFAGAEVFSSSGERVHLAAHTIHDRGDDHRDDDHDDRNDGSIDPVTETHRILIDHGREHAGVGATEKLRRGVRGDAAGEHEHGAGDETGYAQRQGDAQEAAELRGAEAFGGERQVLRDALDDADQRQDHEREEELYETDGDGKFVIEKALRLREESDRHQEPVDDTLLSEDDHPAEGADDRAREHREDGEGHQHALVLREFRDVVGRRVAKQRTQDGAQDTQLQAAEEHLLEVGALKYRRVGGHREIPLVWKYCSEQQ